MPDDISPADDFAMQEGAMRIVLPSTFVAVRQSLGQMRRGLGPLELSDDLLGSIEIVAAEALNNIVEHAYPDTAGIIEIEITTDEKMVNFQIVDTGLEMPGGRVPVGAIRDYPADPEQMPEGGFGWFLIHDLTAHLSYQRSGSRNILLFGFQQGPQAAEIGPASCEMP